MWWESPLVTLSAAFSSAILFSLPLPSPFSLLDDSTLRRRMSPIIQAISSDQKTKATRVPEFIKIRDIRGTTRIACFEGYDAHASMKRNVTYGTRIRGDDDRCARGFLLRHVEGFFSVLCFRLCAGLEGGRREGSRRLMSTNGMNETERNGIDEMDDESVVVKWYLTCKEGGREGEGGGGYRIFFLCVRCGRTVDVSAFCS